MRIETLDEVREFLSQHPNESLKFLKVPLEVGLFAGTELKAVLLSFSLYGIPVEVHDMGGWLVKEKVLLFKNIDTETALKAMKILEYHMTAA